MRLAFQGDTEKLNKLIDAGCRLDRRTGLDPWMTPLDAAVVSGHLACVDLLIGGGAPIIGSAIYEAIVKDSKESLEIFFRHDINFHQKFRVGQPGGNINPKLNNWSYQFTALDLAVSFDSKRCTEFLKQIGAPQHKHIKSCSPLLPVKDEFGKIQRPLAGQKWQFYKSLNKNSIH